MKEFLDSLVGPINKEWCMYFYWIAIFSLCIFVVTAVSGFFKLFEKKNNVTFFSYFMSVFTPFFSYFISRVYYNMCINALA